MPDFQKIISSEEILLRPIQENDFEEMKELTQNPKT